MIPSFTNKVTTKDAKDAKHVKENGGFVLQTFASFALFVVILFESSYF